MNRRSFLSNTALATATTALTGAPLQPRSELHAFEVFGGVCFSAKNAEDARHYSEELFREVVSIKDVRQLRDEELDRQSELYGIDEEPGEAFRSFRAGLEARMSAGKTEPDFFYTGVWGPTSPAAPDGGWTDSRSGEYTPPNGEPVWTSDGALVRRGAWHTDTLNPISPAGWEMGTWMDLHGDRINVTHWRPTNSGFNDVPSPPAS